VIGRCNLLTLSLAVVVDCLLMKPVQNESRSQRSRIPASAMTLGAIADELLFSFAQVLICIAHAAVLFRLYPAGVLVFLTPAIFFVVHLTFLRRRVESPWAVVISLVLTLLGGLAGMVVALNTYGS